MAKNNQGDMSVREAGQKGGERVHNLVEKGKDEERDEEDEDDKDTKEDD